MKYKYRLRKIAFLKREYKKEHLINELHWKTINDILNTNDVICYGNINSHNIVKNSNNKHLNRAANDLKFYKFRQKLEYKASILNKKLILVNEAYTSKTCSFCGCIYNVKESKVYKCSKCQNIIDRDINAAKNILLKGLISSNFVRLK
jgi:IS605 OrfB family transposase